MNDEIVKKQSEGDEAEPDDKEGKKTKGGRGGDLREGNSLGVPKSTALVGKLKQREREWLKGGRKRKKKKKGAGKAKRAS